MTRPAPSVLIGLLVVLCVAAPSAAARAAAEREVTFDGAGGARLVGTLALPEGTGAVPEGTAADPGLRVPAVVLVAGSGPTDRNGNQPPLLWTGLLKQVADALAEGGIASLRYDKRGVGRSTPPPKDREALGRFVAWENFVGDVAAARAALAAQPEVDAGRVALIGHSEGGLLVMAAAAQLQPEGGRAPAAVVLLSTPGRPLDALVREQLAAGFRRQGISDEAAAELLEANAGIVNAIRQTGRVPDDVPPLLAPLYPPYAGGFLKTLFELEPAELAARVPGPVLVVQGEKDLQVSAERDAPALHAALKARKGSPRSDLLLLPGASHNLKRVPPEGGHAFFGPVVPEFRRGVVAWLRDSTR